MDIIVRPAEGPVSDLLWKKRLEYNYRFDQMRKKFPQVPMDAPLFQDILAKMFIMQELFEGRGVVRSDSVCGWFFQQHMFCYTQYLNNAFQVIWAYANQRSDMVQVV